MLAPAAPTRAALAMKPGFALEWSAMQGLPEPSKGPVKLTFLRSLTMVFLYKFLTRQFA